MFFKKEFNGHSFHFVTHNVDDQNNTSHNWFRVTLEQDFFECLRDLGRLPATTTREYIREIRDLEEYKKKYGELKSKPKFNQQ